MAAGDLPAAAKISIVHSVITSYLLQQKQCVLPGLGRLELITIPAISDFVNRQLIAPRQEIRLSADGTTDSNLIDYIAYRKQISFTDARQALNAYCGDLLKSVRSGGTATMPGLGSFSKNESSQVVFTMIPLPAGYEVTVPAERVVRPSAEHQVLVGDIETTNTAMADYYAAAPESRKPWWIAPFILSIAGLGIILYHYLQYPAQGFTGNAHAITPGTTPVQYTESK